MRPPPSDPPEVEAALWDGWKGRLAVDVGAHHGESIWHLRDRFSMVIAYEASTESWTVLTAEWADSNPDVILRPRAVSDHDGMLIMSEREQSMGSGQLVAVRDMPEQDEGLPASQALPWGRETARRSVPCVTLDSEFSPDAQFGGPLPELVKVDTEGHEAQVLAGAAALLARGATGWLIEFHASDLFGQVLDILNAAAYRPMVIRHPHYPAKSRMWHEHGWIRADAPRPTRIG